MNSQNSGQMTLNGSTTNEQNASANANAETATTPAAAVADPDGDDASADVVDPSEYSGGSSDHDVSSAMSQSVQTEDGAADEASATNNDSNSNTPADSSGNSDQDVSSAMSESTQTQTVSVEQIQELLTETVISELGDAQQAARDEYGPDAVVCANIGIEGGELTYEVQELTDGIPDDALHIAGTLNMPGQHRQFTDPATVVASSYDTRTVMQAPYDDDDGDHLHEHPYSCRYIDGAEWQISTDAGRDGEKPTHAEALGGLIRETLDQGFDISVTVDSAEDILRAE